MKKKITNEEKRLKRNAYARRYRATKKGKEYNKKYFHEYYKDRDKNWLYYTYQKTKHRAKLKDLDFNITLDDLVIPEYCPVFGIKLDLNSKDADFRPSIDRIDNSKGYVKGNVHVISWRCNRLKNGATIQELKQMGDYFFNLSLQ